MFAMCTPLLTAAVANPLRRLCNVALYQPNMGTYLLYILDMKLPVMGTIFDLVQTHQHWAVDCQSFPELQP